MTVKLRNTILGAFVLLTFNSHSQNVRSPNADEKEILIRELDSIYVQDQKYRQQITGIEAKYGWESNEMQSLWKVIRKKDSLNLMKVVAILEDYGWLGSDIIGQQGNTTLFLVIQHSDQATQEKYLPVMKDAVTRGNASDASLALLEDRVALGQGKRQLFGSQVAQNPETKEYYVRPLEDPLNVDERRAKVGLPPLSDYVSHWGIKWDAEQYKKMLPLIEEREKLMRR